MRLSSGGLTVVLLALALCGASRLAPAQVILDEIIVTGSDGTISRTGEVVHSEFPGSHTRIGSDKLERRDVTLSEIIAYEAGVQRRQAGGFGSFSSVTVRAASAAQTNIFLDGILLNSAGNSVIDLSMLELFSLGSIDIYRGSTPFQLGQAGLGGAINLTTVPITEQSETRVLAGAGSFNTQRFQLSHSQGWNDWQIMGGLSLQKSDNDYPFVNSFITPLNTADETRQRRRNTQVQRVSGLIRAVRDASADQRSEILLQSTGRGQGVPHWNNQDVDATLDSNAWRVQFAQIIDDIAGWNTRHTVFAHQYRDHYEDVNGEIGLVFGEQDTLSTSRVSGAKTYWERVNNTQTFGVSAEIRRESFRSDNRADSGAAQRAERDSINAVFQWHRFSDDERWLFSPALRAQLDDDQASESRRTSEASRRDLEFSPQLGIQYQFSEKLTLRANAGRFYRQPSFNELYISSGFFIGNSDLQAEQGSNADLGFDWYASELLTVNASLFAAWRDELIATSCDSQGVCRAINTNGARILGLELGTDWSFTEQWSARVNLTLQDTHSLNSFRSSRGKQIPGQAERSLYTRVQYKRGTWRAFYETNGLWGLFYDETNSRPARDHWLHNIGLDWIKGDWRISTSLTNITDRQVEDYFSYARPGRAAAFSVSYQF